MTRKITVSTPEVCAAVRAWDDERSKLGTMDQAIARWRRDVKKLGRAKDIAKQLGLSKRMLYYILKNGGTLKSYRGK